MYGTIFTMRPLAGKEQAVVDHFLPGSNDRVSRIDGLKHSFVFRSETHPGELVCCAIFEDREKYQRNSDDPDQDQWYRQLREMLQADPEWNDGEVVLNLDEARSAAP